MSSRPELPNQGIYTAAAPYYDWHAPDNVADMLGFCDFVMGRHARRPVLDVLEFACGTGRLLLPLARRGYRLTGTDASQPMLDICREQAGKAGVQVELRRELMQDFAEVERYDVLVAIFGAIAFLVDDQAIRRFLSACHAGLRPGGFLLLDVPNGLEGLVHSWAGTTASVHEREGAVLERFLQQIPNTLRGTSLYRDTGLTKTPSGSSWYQEEYLLRIFSLSLLQLLLEPIPFKHMTCYCNWRDREPMQPPYTRLILALEK